jgi:hypothetical protein
MKTQFLVGCLGAAVLVSGCISSVDGHYRGGVPFVKDKIEGRYKRPADQVFAAAREVVKFKGTLVSETTFPGTTNTVRTLEGRVNQRRVLVRVEPVDADVSSVVVQVRTPGGGSDLNLTHEIEKEIALQLAR